MIILLILLTICAIARGTMFKKRDIKRWYAFVPGYNKYIFGKMINEKKLGIINAILQPLVYVVLAAGLGIELWIINNYGTNVYVPNDPALDANIYVEVPKKIAYIAVSSKYALIAVCIAAAIAWVIMTYKFVKLHKKSTLWCILWILMPVIPYCYFAISNDVVIDGKYYTTERVLKENAK